MSEPTLSERVAIARQLAEELNALCVRVIRNEGFEVNIEATVTITAFGLDAAIIFASQPKKLNRGNLERQMSSIVRRALASYLPAGTNADEEIDVRFRNGYEEDLMDEDSAPAGATVHPSFQPFDAEDPVDELEYHLRRDND